MTQHLDPPLRVGAVRLWVLSESRATGRALPKGAGFAASKRPVAIVIDDGTTVAAFTPDGGALTPAALDALSPGLAAQIATSRIQDRG